MATSARPKAEKFLTPTGIAVYPKLNAPDTKFKPLGEFNTKLKLSAEAAQPLIDKYEEVLAAYFEKEKAELMKGDGKSKAKAKALKLAADKPYKPEYDEEGEETGFMVINFKMPHKIDRSKDGKPDLLLYPDIFDASSPKPLKNPPEIWGGSKLRVAGEMRPFNTAIGVGLSLRLQAVQIIELTSKGSRDAGGYGFGQEEGGYASDDTPAEGASPFSAGAAPADDDGPAEDNPDF